MKAFLTLWTFALMLASGLAGLGWLDKDTPKDKMTIKSFTDGLTYDLVMSDEFELEGRSFKDGDDPTWTAIDRSDDDQTSQGKKSLQYYNSSNVRTKNGKLIIETNTEDTKWKGWNPFKKKYETMSRNFKSGMMQSWNKFCFTGGIVEVNVKFPGKGNIGGLWPAVWLLGNLGRATFESSTNLVWPWSYSKCDRALQKAQKVNGCSVTNHFNMNPQQGRGATEIDIIEVMAGEKGNLPVMTKNISRPYSSMTLQLAPGVPAHDKRPMPGTLPEWGFKWYENLTFGEDTSINPFFYGTYLAATKKEEPVGRAKDEAYQCDALGAMVALSEDNFKNFHKFRVEWQPGKDGYVHWYMDDIFRYGVEAEGLEFMDTFIPNEPSYLILNTAVSTSWGFPTTPPDCEGFDCKVEDMRCGFNKGFCELLPAKFEIEHVRVYQNKKDKRMSVTCNPQDYPTKRFIKANEYKYKLLNKPRSLEHVKVGGEKCSSDVDCFNGKCQNYIFYKTCKCANGFTGPKCMVPAYENADHDWDVDFSLLVFVKPYFPHFLVLVIIFFMIMMVVATLSVWDKKRRTLDVVKTNPPPSWL